MKSFMPLLVISSLLSIAEGRPRNVARSIFPGRRPVQPHLNIVQGESWRGGSDEPVVAVSPETKLPDSIADIELAVDEEELPSALAKKMANFQERLLPAILMLGGVGLWAYFLKEDGMIFMTLVLQGGMYQEVTRVIGGDFSHFFSKWWWFATATVAINAPRMFPWAQTEITAITYGMTIFGILTSIVGFNRRNAGVEEFREYVREAAVSFLAMLLVVAPTSFWISTLEEYGMKWMVYPGILVIINDTMAYVFGMAMGKHALLPSISPKKTWEGLLGAAVSTVAAAWFLMPEKQDALAFSTFVSLVGPFGGFLASVVKRAYSQKDFGALFPGHGGLVDRLDCQVILAPFVYLYLTLSRNGSDLP